MMIAVHKLTKRYRDATQKALDDVSFSVAEGDCVGLLGPNGAGKTTLIKLLCGVIPPSTGAIHIAGHDPYYGDRMVKHCIGVVHQRITFDYFLTPDDNLAIAAAYWGLKWASIRSTVTRLLDMFHLTDCRSRPVFTLSGGQTRRLQVVRALLKQPRLLILDEPSVGLDVTGRHEVWSVLQTLRDEHQVTILWSSHYVEELERNCDQALILKQGQVVRFEMISQLVAQFGCSRLVLDFPAIPDSTVCHVLSQLGTYRLSQHNTQLEIWGEGIQSALPAIMNSLQPLGWTPHEIRIIPSNLEDAYLALTEGQDYVYTAAHAHDRRVGLHAPRVSVTN